MLLPLPPLLQLPMLVVVVVMLFIFPPSAAETKSSQAPIGESCSVIGELRPFALLP